MHPCMSRLARLQQMGACSSDGRSQITGNERLCDPGSAGLSSRKLRQVPRTKGDLQEALLGNHQKTCPTTFATVCSFLYFILQFWNQILTRWSQSLSSVASSCQIGAVVELLLPPALAVGEGHPPPYDDEPVHAWYRRSKEKGTVRSTAVCLTTLSRTTLNVREAPFNNPQPISPSKGPELSA